jgi:hypothetical protein
MGKKIFISFGVVSFIMLTFLSFKQYSKINEINKYHDYLRETNTNKLIKNNNTEKKY